MHDGSAQVWSLGIDIHWNLFLFGVKAFVSSSSDKASDGGQSLGAAERLNILVKNLIGRGHIRNWILRQFNFIGIVWRWGAVLLRQTGRNLRASVAAMTRIAGHLAFPTKVGFVERIHHKDHSTRH